MGLRTYQNLILLLFTFSISIQNSAQEMDTMSVDLKPLSMEAGIHSLQPSQSDSSVIQLSNAILSKIDSVMELAIRKQAFPGGVLHISLKDTVLIHKAYGYHTYDSVRPVERYHIYDLASVTKVTAATLSLMKLYDDGLIDLDGKVKDYVPGIGIWNKKANANIRETLAHQAGWRPWIPYYQDMINDKGYKGRFFREEYSEKYPIKITDSLYLTRNNYKYIKRQIKRSDFDENRGYVYSGLFFYLIPEIVELQSGMAFEEFVQKEIYQKTGSLTTTFNPLDKYPESLIVPTELDSFFRQTQIHGTVHDEGAIVMGGVSGNAGLFSNATDLAKVWRMLLNDGMVDTTQIISSRTVDLFTTAQYPNEDNRRGLGFDKPLIQYNERVSSVAKDASFRSYGHSGYTGPLIWADPENDLLFVFLANRVYPSRNQRQIYELGVRPTLHQYCYDLVKLLDR